LTGADIGAAQAMLPALMLASIRPGAAFLAAPVFGAPQVPVLLRFVLAVAVGVPGSLAATMILPPGGMASVAGFALIVGEIIIGLALGFALQTGFAATSIAGEAIGNAMGLGFAATIDPMSGTGTPAIGQVLTILATLLFLSMDGHLAFITVIIESYRALPIGGGLISGDAVGAIIRLGGAMFAASVVLALPVVTGVILIQLVMAMLARSAPALNLFAVGLPAAVLGGLVLFAFAMPMLGGAISRSLVATLEDTARIVAR
jgi:flagellar biosynthesis protein FliR